MRDRVALVPGPTSEELGVDDPADEAHFRWNIMIDPREIFDLLNTVGFTEKQVSQRLYSAFCGALVGGAADRSGESIAHRAGRVSVD